MKTRNIQIGIDLGTTNSEVAVNHEGNVLLVKNIFGDEYTPSVFGIDKAKNKVVGKRAYERLFKESNDTEIANNKAEVKRLMGTEEKVLFERIGKEMSAEEISAEILKSLKEDVSRKYPRLNTCAAVITIPAYFSTLQAEATKRSGVKAGFEHVVLLQEPIAAAISYGFMSVKDENSLVFDLGGGTFDVALISSKGGALTVLSHQGDNFLGGKDFDWALVDKVIVPTLVKDYSLVDFNRGNEKYKSVFAKLKYIAENTKLYLSQYDTAHIEVDGIGEDDNGKEIYSTFQLTRNDFEKIIKPFVDKTISLVQNTIDEAGVKPSEVRKIILVGAPTQIPYIRDRLASTLRIEIDTTADPLTTVAHGACIFASSQIIPDEILVKDKGENNAEKQVKLFYESLTSETEEEINGVIDELKDSDEDYFIQISGDSGFYSGAKTKLSKGKFRDQIPLEEKKVNLFWIYLFDAKGNTVPIEPDSFSITHGLSIAGAPIPHAIGIAVAKKDIKSEFVTREIFDRYFEKHSVLPLRDTKVYRTAKKVRKGDTSNALPIKVYEGESEIPDRNHKICDLRITGENVPYDLPEGTEVEIAIELDESRVLTVSAYIPSIDLTANARATTYAESLTVEQLDKELSAQSNRKSAVFESCSTEEKRKINELSQSLSTSLRNANIDDDEKRKANKELKELKSLLDNLETQKKLPQLIREYDESVGNCRSFIDQYADEEEKEKYNEELDAICREGEKAKTAEDEYLLKRVNEQLTDLSATVLYSNPTVWAYKFRQLAKEENNFISQQDAQHYIKKGERAIELGDVDELKRCVHNLILLLPQEEQEAMQSDFSGITH